MAKPRIITRLLLPLATACSLMNCVSRYTINVMLDEQVNLPPNQPVLVFLLDQLSHAEIEQIIQNNQTYLSRALFTNSR